MSDPNDDAPVTFRGSEHEVVRRLAAIFTAGAPFGEVHQAARQVNQGNRFVACAGERLEVEDPSWSIVQDVYGCPDGRQCTDVSAAQRERFEAMIRARRANEE